MLQGTVPPAMFTAAAEQRGGYGSSDDDDDGKVTALKSEMWTWGHPFANTWYSMCF